jgi:hypothetical protein
MAAKVFGTIFVMADQQTLDCSIVRACPRDWWIVTAVECEVAGRCRCKMLIAGFGHQANQHTEIQG